MKRILLSMIFSLSLINFSIASPSNSITIPNTFSSQTTISSSQTNANNNEIATKFNAHTHNDITQLGSVTSGTWLANTIGVPYGGTGVASVTAGSYIQGNGTGALVERNPAQVKTDLSLNNVENTALSTWTGATSIITLGTIGTGTWNATAIANGKGGIGTYKIDSGLTGDVLATSDVSVNFNFVFGSTPVLVLGTLYNGDGDATNFYIKSISNNSFVLRNQSSQTKKCYWIAYGPG